MKGRQAQCVHTEATTQALHTCRMCARGSVYNVIVCFNNSLQEHISECVLLLLFAILNVMWNCENVQSPTLITRMFSPATCFCIPSHEVVFSISIRLHIVCIPLSLLRSRVTKRDIFSDVENEKA